MTRAALVNAGLALLVLACARDPLAPEGHLLVWIDTDAPAPRLLDVVRVQVVAPAGRVVDERDLPLDETSLANGLGFSVIPAAPNAASGTLHVTAWLARDGRGTPRGTEAVEGWFALPAAPEVGTREVTLVLGLDDVGSPIGSPAAPAALIEGHPPSRRGTWAGAQAVPCAGDPAAGEVCIPGGAYWMGHPRAAGLGVTSGGDRRLVVLAPFFFDRHEVTVAAYRRDGKVFAGRWSGTYGGASEKDYCTFTDAPGDHDDLPLNCVQWKYARAYCMSLGGDLPSEAQIEWVASAFGRSLYPWGDDAPGCDDAVWGRGGASNVPEIQQQPGPCRPRSGTPRARSGAPEAVTRADHGRDRLVLADGSTVDDLAGNLVEWARDAFVPLGDACWSPRQPNVFFDPVCSAAPDAGGPAYAARGTSFYLPRSLAASAVRGGAVEGAHLDLGFRCMRPARP